MEKGQLAKTLEAVGCRVARAKDYSWKVKDMSQNCHIHVPPLSKVWLEDQSDDIVSVGGKTESYR